MAGVGSDGRPRNRTLGATGVRGGGRLELRKSAETAVGERLASGATGVKGGDVGGDVGVGGDQDWDDL